MNLAGVAYGADLVFWSVPDAPVTAAATNTTTAGFSANWNAAKLLKMVRPDNVSVGLPAGIEFSGSRARQEIPYLQGGQKTDVRWTVKMAKPVSGDVDVMFSSTRGGVIKGKVKIG